MVWQRKCSASRVLTLFFLCSTVFLFVYLLTALATLRTCAGADDVLVASMGGGGPGLVLTRGETMTLDQPPLALRVRVPYLKTRASIGPLVSATRAMSAVACQAGGGPCDGLNDLLHRWGGATPSPLDQLEAMRHPPSSSNITPSNAVTLAEYPFVDSSHVTGLVSNASDLDVRFVAQALFNAWKCVEDAVDELDLALRTGEQGVVPSYGPLSCRVAANLATNMRLPAGATGHIDCSGLGQRAVYLRDQHLVVDVLVPWRVEATRYVATPLPLLANESRSCYIADLPTAPFRVLADRDWAVVHVAPQTEDAGRAPRLQHHPCLAALAASAPNATSLCGGARCIADEDTVAVRTSAPGQWYVAVATPSLMVAKSSPNARPRRIGLSRGRHIVVAPAGWHGAVYVGRLGNLCAMARPAYTTLLMLPAATTATATPRPVPASSSRAAPRPTATPRPVPASSSVAAPTATTATTTATPRQAQASSSSAAPRPTATTITQIATAEAIIADTGVGWWEVVGETLGGLVACVASSYAAMHAKRWLARRRRGRAGHEAGHDNDIELEEAEGME